MRDEEPVEQSLHGPGGPRAGPNRAWTGRAGPDKVKNKTGRAGKLTGRKRATGRGL